MLISAEKSFVFVANTKTASSSIETALEPFADYRHGGSPQRKHLPLRRAEAVLPDFFSGRGLALSDYFVFGVMREPLSWVDSWFRYRKRPKLKNAIPADMDFETFWATQYRGREKAEKRKSMQSFRFMGKERTVLADVIIPYDRLDEHLARVLGGLGLQIDELPHMNKSRAFKGQTQVPAHLEAEVKEYFRRDYRLWNQIDTLNATGFEKLASRQA